jgi:hypothetical protein
MQVPDKQDRKETERRRTGETETSAAEVRWTEALWMP